LVVTLFVFFLLFRITSSQTKKKKIYFLAARFAGAAPARESAGVGKPDPVAGAKPPTGAGADGAVTVPPTGAAVAVGGAGAVAAGADAAAAAVEMAFLIETSRCRCASGTCALFTAGADVSSTPNPGTRMFQFCSRCSCTSFTSSVSDLRCLARAQANDVTVSTKSSAISSSTCENHVSLPSRGSSTSTSSTSGSSCSRGSICSTSSCSLRLCTSC